MHCYTVDGNSGLTRQERPDPVAPQPGQVLVGVYAVSLNYRDLMVVDGRYGPSGRKPIIPCSDMAGVVLEVGEGVYVLRPGDRVLNAPFRCWPAGRLRSEWAKTFVGGGRQDGVLAQLLIYPATSLVKVPSNLSLIGASTLPVAGLTAWAAVVTHGKTQPGEWVLLHGTGGVSVFGAQIAKAMGARTLLSTSSDSKAALATQRLGVDHVFDYRKPDWPKQVRKLTNGRGVDVVVEVAGGQSLSGSIQSCGYGGRVGVIGVLDGFDSQINVLDLLKHQVTVRGIFMESAEQLQSFVNSVEVTGLEPQIDRVFPFEDAGAAYEYMQSAQHFGKVVIQLRCGEE